MFNFCMATFRERGPPSFFLEDLCYFLTISSPEGFWQFCHDAQFLAWKPDLLKYPILTLFSLQSHGVVCLPHWKMTAVKIIAVVSKLMKYFRTSLLTPPTVSLFPWFLTSPDR